MVRLKSQHMDWDRVMLGQVLPIRARHSRHNGRLTFIINVERKETGGLLYELFPRKSSLK